ncbi:MAG: stage II sporulation protein M [Pseudomonadota bacterium]
MKQSQFEQTHAALWTQIGSVLADEPEHRAALPALYRRLCQCLALAVQRGYSPALTDYLQTLVGACHKRLYGSTAGRPHTLVRWLLVDLPRRVRAEWRLLLVALVAFWGVALAVGLLVWWQPHWAYSFSDPAALESYRKMYQPGQFRHGRGEQGDLLMFGFYIWHNVSICFRTFAGGIFGGIPALLSLGLNGMHAGVIASWLSRDAATVTPFWSFVVTHSSFEITGLMLSALAGMRLGLSLIAPGRLARRHALQAASEAMYPVILGGALLTMLAAFFEAFWSANAALPPSVKYGVGALCWTLVIGFFLFAGRRGADAAR